MANLIAKAYPLLDLTADTAGSLRLHSQARAAFEAWLALPATLRPMPPALPGLVIVVPDGPEGAPAVVFGFGAYLHARATGEALCAVLMPLSPQQARAAAEGEVALLQAAISMAPTTGKARSDTGSLLAAVLRDGGAA